MSGNAAQLCGEHGGTQGVSRKAPAQVLSKAPQTVRGGFSAGRLLQLRSTGSEKGLSAPGRAWPAASLSLGPSIQAVTEEGPARGDLQPMQVPRTRERKTRCRTELRVLRQSTRVPCNEQKAGGCSQSPASPQPPAWPCRGLR